MKRQKKLSSSLLAGALLLSLAACGQTVQPSGGSSSGSPAAGSDGSQTTPTDGLVTTAAGHMESKLVHHHDRDLMALLAPDYDY